MDLETLHTSLVHEFGIEHLPRDKQDIQIALLAHKIQKEFLNDVYKEVGPEKFALIEEAAKKNDEAYSEALKVVLPNLEATFEASRKRVIEAYRNHNK